MAKRGTKQRSEVEIALHQAEALPLFLQRVPLRQIQTQLKKKGIELSHEQIRQDMDALAKQLAAENKDKLAQEVEMDILRLEYYERELVQGWARSCGKKVIDKRQVKDIRPKGKDDDRTDGVYGEQDQHDPRDGKFQEVTETKETQKLIGDPKFLAEAKSCLVERHRLRKSYDKTPEGTGAGGPEAVALLQEVYIPGLGVFDPSKLTPEAWEILASCLQQQDPHVWTGGGIQEGAPDASA